MLLPKPARPPEAIATGVLATKPIAHLLVYALDRRLTGTFELVDDTRERIRIVVESGMLVRVSTSEPVVYLGHVLYENGVITAEQLSESLAEVAATKALHGQVLLAKGMVQPEQLTDALRQQRARKLHRAFQLSPRATFAFFPNVDLVGERPGDVEPVDPLPFIWRGVRAHPSWEHVRATLSIVGGRKLRVVGAVERLELGHDERSAATLLRRASLTVPELANRAGLSTRGADLLAYFLVITKVAEIAEKVGVTVPPVDAATHPVNALGATLGSGVHPRKISFTMRAVGADTNLLRIPSPMPGRIQIPPTPVRIDMAAPDPVASTDPPKRHSSVPPTLRSAGTPMPGTVAAAQPPPRAKGYASPDRPRTGERTTAAGRARNVKAEQALSQAEMHLVLGEREMAAGFVRSALAEAPGMPAAKVMLAYIEAAALGEGQEAKVLGLVKVIDQAIGEEETCPHARYYRATLKMRLGDHEGAIRDLRVAVVHDPDDVDAQGELRPTSARCATGQSCSAPCRRSAAHRRPRACSTGREASDSVGRGRSEVAARAHRGALLRIDSLRRGQDTEDVAAENLTNRLLGQPSLKKRVDEQREPGRVRERRARHDEPVPVASEGGGLLPGHVEDVLEVADHGSQSVASEVPGAEEDTDDAPLAGYGAELLVVDVAPVGEGAGGPRVAHDGARAQRLARVHEAASVHVGEVDEDAERLAALDERVTERSEPVRVVPPRTVRREARLVGAEVGEAQVADPPSGEGVELPEVPFERVRSLDPEQRTNRAGCVALLDLGGRPDLAERAVAAGGGRVQSVDLLVHGAGEATRHARERQRDEAEELAARPSALQARQVDVTAEGRAGEGRGVAPEQVVPKPTHPHQRVGVQIDRGAGVEDRPCVRGGERKHPRHAERARGDLASAGRAVKGRRSCARRRRREPRRSLASCAPCPPTRRSPSSSASPRGPG